MWNKTILLLKADSAKEQNEYKCGTNYKILDYGTKCDSQGNKSSMEEKSNLNAEIMGNKNKRPWNKT
jgi:hypothetical protein